MNHVRRNFLVVLLVFSGMMLAARPAAAQATFQVSAASSTVTTIGHAEPIGEVTLTINAGTSVAGHIEVSYPVALTNDASTGISVVGTGGLAGATVAVAANSGIVIVNVPAGGGIGNSVTIMGPRYSPSTFNGNIMRATVSSAGNFVTAGQGVVTVVGTSAEGLTLTAAPSPAFSVVNGLIVSGPSDFVITEGHEAAFTSDVGVRGQTVPTQVIFRVIGLPDNVTLTFPATVTGDTNATLTAMGQVVLTNQSISNLVVYQFGASPSSPNSLDRFSVTPVVGVTGPGGTGTAFIQAGLGPIGAATPTASLPSTAIPRFSENYLPPLSSLPGAVLTLNFPTSPLATSQTLSVSNLGSGGAALNFIAHRTDGSITTSSVNPVLTPRETRTFTLPQLFGTVASTSSIASVQVESLSSRLLGMSLDSAPGGLAATAAAGESQQFILPLNLTNTREAALSVINSGSGASIVSLRLRAASGQIISSASLNVQNGTTLRTGLLSAFGVTAASVPANAFVEGTSTIPVRVSAFSNPQGPVEELTALAPVAVRSYRLPFFATGGGYTSVLTLVNASIFPLQVHLTPTQTNGTGFGVNPIVQVVAPLARADIDFASFFPNNTPLRTGYLTMIVDRADSPNPFSTPLLAGAVQIRIASAAALVPLFADKLTDSYIGSVAEDDAYYTGVALLNEYSTDLNATVDVFSAAGTLIGSKALVLPPRTLQAQLIRELVPAAAGQTNALVRITTTNPIGIIGFRGAWNLSELLFLPPQR